MRIGLAVFCGVAIVAALAAGSNGRAEEAKNSAPEDPIAVAKRDYEALKEGAVDAKQEKRLLSPQSVPVLDANTELTPTLSPLARQRQTELKAAEKRSKNWLLDAMAEQKESDAKERNLRGRDAKPKAHDLIVDASASESGHDLTGESAALSSTTKKRETQEKPERSETANPLASYMSSWMSPGDFALLKPTSNSRLGDTSVTSESLVQKEPISAPADGARDGPLFQANVPLPSSGSHPENPYLTDQSEAPSLLGPSSSPVSSPPQLSDTRNRSSPVPAASEQSNPSGAAPSARDFAKPDSDAKYFKQLKRF
jgi:hypothetical protein